MEDDLSDIEHASTNSNNDTEHHSDPELYNYFQNFLEVEVSFLFLYYTICFFIEVPVYYTTVKRLRTVFLYTNQ